MTITPDTGFSLRDRWTRTSGEILLTGVQALVRVPFDQLRADRRDRLRTTAFFSGYQGSPLGTFDSTLAAEKAQLEEFGAVHQPGQNEELAATSVMGSQLAAGFRTARHDGVIGVWYGKAPGVERAGDAIHHAQFAGTAPRGGVLALAGDDPAAKSSTLPSRSEPLLAHYGLPVLYPGTVDDVLWLGRHGITLSRTCGLWTALKVVTPVADGTGIAVVDPDAPPPVIPELQTSSGLWVPELTGAIGPPAAANREADVIGTRVEMAQSYISANGLNRFAVDPAEARLGIVAGGHTAEVVLEALRALGLGPDQLARGGIRVLKLGALHPLERDAVRRLARGTATVLVVEDKQPWLETLVRDALYGMADAPEVLGKRDGADRPLVPLAGGQTVAGLIAPLRRLLAERLPDLDLAPPATRRPIELQVTSDAVRSPYFCSGCPHNTSTKVPEGALVGAGIGCHGMVVMMEPDKVGEIIGITQMGGEGAQWIGIAPFVDDDHLFQNLGDGTFFHSGQLPIQAAIAARVNLTFKLLYNRAVAMTGGQDATGALTVPQISRKLLAEGVARIVVTTDEPDRYRGDVLPSGVAVRHRDDIVAVQDELRAVPGVTVLIHDQQCAAEKRRDRKRGLLDKPGYRIVIDERICEGCGDCGVASNCLSLQPLDTEFGRKTVVDQASCNFDRSCLKGDCPAFVSVVPAPGGRSTGGVAGDAGDLPEPELVVPADATIRMPGIGGTGVVTVAQILAAAAKIEGRPATTLDQTGLSQKAGPVVSTVTIGDPVPGRVDTLLAFDLLATTTEANVAGVDADHTVVIASTSMVPTGRMVGRVATSNLDPAPYQVELDGRSRSGANRYADAAHLTIGLLGSAVTANLFLLGLAHQAGAVPLAAESIEQAVALNGVAVEANQAAFRWGRRYALDPAAVEAAAGDGAADTVDTTDVADLADDPELARLAAIRAEELTRFQDGRLARRYLDVVRRCHRAEVAAGGDGSFSRTVAHQLHRVWAYKDEYEVARLMLGTRDRLERSGGPIDRLTWHLHPPMLRALGMDRKLELGPSSEPVLTALHALRRLRGTRLDPFGRTEVRRAERWLAADYLALVDELVPTLATDHARAVRLAGLVDMVRGYESLKLRNLEAYRRTLAAER